MRIKYLKNCLLLAGAFWGVAVLTGCNSSINPDNYIELGQYKGLEVERATHFVTDEEIEDELYTLASAYATEEELNEGSVQDGDVANIDYVGTLNGVAFDGGTASGYNLDIGSGTFIKGFESGLVGVNIGDTVDLNLTFPENYGKSELAGQDVVFTVTVNSVSRKEIPEVTDDFIKEVSEGQYTSLDEYVKALEKQIIDEYEEYNNLQYYEDLWNLAVDNATVKKDFPTELINDKTSRMIVNAQKYATSYGISMSQFVEEYMGMSSDEFYSQAADYAVQAAKEAMVMQAIAKKENISVTQEDINKAIAEYIEIGTYSSKEEFEENNNMDDFKDYILLSKIEDFLAENAAK